jgi:hypothetical protein
LLRIRRLPCVSDPVVADVVRIEAPQIRGDEDEVRSGARRVRIDCHALRCAGRIGKRVRIVVVLLFIERDVTRRAGWTGLRNAGADQSISLRGIA